LILKGLQIRKGQELQQSYNIFPKGEIIILLIFIFRGARGSLFLRSLSAIQQNPFSRCNLLIPFRLFC
jgi:hypothetical protein